MFHKNNVKKIQKFWRSKIWWNSATKLATLHYLHYSYLHILPTFLLRENENIVQFFFKVCRVNLSPISRYDKMFSIESWQKFA